MRHLATIRKIDQVLPIEGADAIVLVKIDGWQCVAKKEEFQVGDLCVYYEIDSYLPLRPQYEHIRSRAYKKMGDQEGIRIKTIKLRGQISQGLALPVSLFVDEFVDSKFDEGQELCEFFYLGADITDFLGVQKYEPPVPTQLAGQVSGNFPSFIKKTEQARCQNLVRDIFVTNIDTSYEVTMKMDGTSFTAFVRNREAMHGTEPGVGGQMAWSEMVVETGVCGRNWELKVDENPDNSLVRMFVHSGLQAALTKFGGNYAVQGELMGPGIQNNREGFVSHRLFVFDIYDIDASEYVSPLTRRAMLDELYTLGVNREMVSHVPIIGTYLTMSKLGIENIDQLLAYAEGASLSHAIREGLVFKSVDGKFTFKVISNRYLLKEED